MRFLSLSLSLLVFFSRAPWRAGGARAAGNKENLAEKRDDARGDQEEEKERETNYGTERKMMSQEEERADESMRNGLGGRARE